MLRFLALDCELAVYRKGFLAVHIDLARGYLTWRESNRWYNNFTRTLSPEQIDWLNSVLSSVALIESLPVCNDVCLPIAGHLLASEEQAETGSTEPDQVPISPQHRLAWSIIARTGDGCYEKTGLDSLPLGWNQLADIIETISRMPFCL